MMHLDLGQKFIALGFVSFLIAWMAGRSAANILRDRTRNALDRHWMSAKMQMACGFFSAISIALFIVGICLW